MRMDINDIIEGIVEDITNWSADNESEILEDVIQEALKSFGVNEYYSSDEITLDIEEVPGAITLNEFSHALYVAILDGICNLINTFDPACEEEDYDA